MKSDTAIAFGVGCGALAAAFVIISFAILTYCPIWDMDYLVVMLPKDADRSMPWGMGMILGTILSGIGTGALSGSLSFYFSNRPAKLCPKCKEKL